jgi:hypothetical protein
MTIAIIKFKVKVLGNFSEDIRKLPISGLVAVKARKSLKSQGGGLRKKLKITIYYQGKRIVTQGGGARLPRLSSRCRAGTRRTCPKEAGGSALWALISTKFGDWPYNLDTGGQAKGLADIRGRFTDSGKEVVYRGKSDAYLSCWGN